jgi:hypothetical protein
VRNLPDQRDTMQQPSAKFLIHIDGERKSYILWNGTDVYYKKLRAAYVDISKDVKSDYLHFGFFTLCASTLEYSLNFILTDYCVNKFGPDKYKSYAEGYINMQFGKKLLMGPSIISGGQFTTNEDSPTFKNLMELISLRNRILHNKEFLKEFDIPKDQKLTDFKFDLKLDPNPIDTLTKDNCLKFGDSLGIFKKLIMTPALTGDLEENELLKKVED